MENGAENRVKPVPENKLARPPCTESVETPSDLYSQQVRDDRSRPARSVGSPRAGRLFAGPQRGATVRDRAENIYFRAVGVECERSQIRTALLYAFTPPPPPAAAAPRAASPRHRPRSCAGAPRARAAWDRAAVRRSPGRTRRASPAARRAAPPA